MQQRNEPPEITWTMPLDKANMILQIIGKQPFDTVADLIMDLRSQATAQIQMLQQQQLKPPQAANLERSPT